MYLKLRQVYFDESQLSGLDSGCVPYSSVGIEPQLYENQHIIDLTRKNDHYDARYWGLTSWRMNSKTGLTKDEIERQMKEQDGADVYIYNNYGHEFNLLQNKDFPLGKVIKMLYDKKIIPFTNEKMSWVNVFCNYWVATPQVIDKYLTTFLLPVVDALYNDPDISAEVNSEMFPHRGKMYPIHPFVLEYLFGLFVYHHPELKVIRLKDKNIKQKMRPLRRIFKDFRETTLYSGGGDKGTIHHYIESYERLFAPVRTEKINVLEIGINRGDSLKMWREYFPNANIYGIDIVLPKEKIEGVTMLQCSQVDAHRINELFKDVNFDIIIDDGSHKIQHQLLSAKYFWSKMNRNGLYIIEDIQEPDIDVPVLSLGFRQPTEIIDTRKQSGRYDDMLIVWKK